MTCLILLNREGRLWVPTDVPARMREVLINGREAVSSTPTLLVPRKSP